MAASQGKTTIDIGKGVSAPESNLRSNKIDPKAPAGSKNSLGEESVRDGRPDTDDSVVEAIDEVGPGITSLEKQDK